jgi:hypothetical protein
MNTSPSGGVTQGAAPPPSVYDSYYYAAAACRLARRLSQPCRSSLLRLRCGAAAIDRLGGGARRADLLVAQGQALRDALRERASERRTHGWPAAGVGGEGAALLLFVTRHPEGTHTRPPSPTHGK